MSRAKVTDFVVTNGAKLYCERQGVGQALIFIAGSTGDAGNFTRWPTCWLTSSPW